MKCSDINIRDPFVIYEDGTYYMYGTRGKDFGIKTGGFDVYTSKDLIEWSAPVECFSSEKYGLNSASNWAPEVHEYKGSYYMFATFLKPEGLRGTYILKSDSLTGPFEPWSEGAATPDGWECLDGTLYVSKDGEPYIVFCHEHTQIIDGTICYQRLSDDLKHAEGEPVTLFSASSCGWGPLGDGHYITDGPFMHRTQDGTLLMIWSTFIEGQYAVCVVKFTDGELNENFEHLAPILDNDGGHGMIFGDESSLYLSVHTPNKSLLERPVFIKIHEEGGKITLA